MEPDLNTFIGQLQAGWGTALLKGLAITLQVSVGGYITGLILGGLVAWIKIKGRPWAVRLANLYSTIGRSIPEILLILILFYAGQQALNSITDMVGLSNVTISAFFSAIIVLGIVQGAYASEILRGAYTALPSGQIEAARAYGLHGFRLFRRIIAPLMIPYAFAGMVNLWLSILKDSALIYAIGYTELIFTTEQAAASTRMYLEFYLLCGAIYYIFTQISNIAVIFIEKYFRRWTPLAG